MRILMVCQHYWPESFQITAICEALAERGHEVTALVGLPNYPDGIIPKEYRRGGNRHQKKDGVTIIRVNEIARRHGAVGLALNYYSFAWAAKAAVRKLDQQFDVVFAYQLSPVMMAQPAVLYKQLAGVPLLLYCCDLWPESMKVMLGNKGKRLFNRYQKVSFKVYQEADLLLVQSPAFTQYFKEVHGIPDSRLRYVPQFASDKYLGEDFSCARGDKVNFVFLGNMGRAQDLPCIVKAVEAMRHRDRFLVHFVGDGACLDEVRALVLEKGLESRFVFHGKHPFSDMPRFYRLADACLLTLDGSSWVGTTLPSKLQGYMAAGKPVLAAINGGARRVIDDSGCGRAVDAGNSKGLAKLMDQFIDDPDLFAPCGEAGRAYFRANFTKQRYIDAVEDALAQLCERSTRD